MTIAPAADGADAARLPALEHELRLLRAYALVTYPFACVPFLFLFFGQHGLDQQGFGEVVAVYYIAMFAAEMPTGILADRTGPRPMLVLGPLLLASGFTLLVLWPTYAGFVAGEALLGAGHAVLSGPPAVMLYATLARHGQQHRYLDEEARINARRLYGTGCAFLLGGLGARLGGGDAYHLAIWLTCALVATAGLVALALPHHRGRPVSRAMFRGAVDDLRRPAVLWLFAYWVVLFALLRYPFHNYQPYFAAASRIEPLLGDPLVVGLLFALMNLAAAPLSGLAPRLVARFGRLALFFAMPLVLVASFVVTGAERLAADSGHATRLGPWLGVAMSFVQQVPFGLHTALLQEFTKTRDLIVTPGVRLNLLSFFVKMGAPLRSVDRFDWGFRLGAGWNVFSVGIAAIFVEVDAFFWEDVSFKDAVPLTGRVGVEVGF